MDFVRIGIVGLTGAIRAGLGVWKNSTNENFEFKVKKAIPTCILGFGVGAVIGAQELPLDGNLELGLEIATSLGITVFVEEAFKGVWKRWIVDSRIWLAIKDSVS